MDIRVSVEHGSVPVTVLQIIGSIDAASYTKFQQAAENAIANGARHILIDLSEAPFVSSAGLRALHIIFNQLRKSDPDDSLSDEDVRRGINAGTYKSPHLKLLNLSKETRTTFELSGFDMFLETFANHEAAIASFKAAS